MAASPTDNKGEDREGAVGREGDQLGEEEHCGTRLGYRWTGGQGRRYIKRKEMDDEWTGLALYRAQQGHLSRLMAYTS
jgi:hypothetical protein